MIDHRKRSHRSLLRSPQPPCNDPVSSTVVYRLDPDPSVKHLCLRVDQLPFGGYSYTNSLRPSKGITNYIPLPTSNSRYLTYHAELHRRMRMYREIHHYPTAALSQKAYGSSQNYGPGCGRCFKLTLLNSYTSSPPFFPNAHPSVVVKVTDLCPLSQNGWCSGTENKTNPYVLKRLWRSRRSPFFAFGAGRGAARGV